MNQQNNNILDDKDRKLDELKSEKEMLQNCIIKLWGSAHTGYHLPAEINNLLVKFSSVNARLQEHFIAKLDFKAVKDEADDYARYAKMLWEISEEVHQQLEIVPPLRDKAVHFTELNEDILRILFTEHLSFEESRSLGQTCSLLYNGFFKLFRANAVCSLTVHYGGRRWDTESQVNCHDMRAQLRQIGEYGVVAAAEDTSISALQFTTSAAHSENLPCSLDCSLLLPNLVCLEVTGAHLKAEHCPALVASLNKLTSLARLTLILSVELICPNFEDTALQVAFFWDALLAGLRPPALRHLTLAIVGYDLLSQKTADRLKDKQQSIVGLTYYSTRHFFAALNVHTHFNLHNTPAATTTSPLIAEQLESFRWACPNPFPLLVLNSVVANPRLMPALPANAFAVAAPFVLPQPRLPLPLMIIPIGELHRNLQLRAAPHGGIKVRSVLQSDMNLALNSKKDPRSSVVRDLLAFRQLLHSHV
ncbi:hypothetical protein TYRP_016604 [Tyrophagus putrescentiae]|nr:hypothetical protein TYRP_016604 [Tyrophagus putrescentiae]